MIAKLVLLAALAASSLTRLPAAGGGGPITVSAEKVRYQFPKHRIEYTGNPVRLTRGDSVLTCKQLIAQLDETDQVKTATCEGDVRFDRGEKTITCEKATYDEAAARLTCEGNPVIKSGGITARGDLLVYDLNADEVTMDKVTGDVPADDADHTLQRFQERRKPRPVQGAQR